MIMEWLTNPYVWAATVLFLSVYLLRDRIDRWWERRRMGREVRRLLNDRRFWERYYKEFNRMNKLEELDASPTTPSSPDTSLSSPTTPGE